MRPRPQPHRHLHALQRPPRQLGVGQLRHRHQVVGRHRQRHLADHRQRLHDLARVTLGEPTADFALHLKTAQLNGLAGNLSAATEALTALLAAKHARWGDAFRWHFIGHLQSRKAPLVSEVCELCHSLDSESAARRLSIPALVEEIDDETALEISIIENLQREHLNPIEIAISYQRLMADVGLSPEDVAKKVSKDRTTVVNFLRLL